MENEEERNLFAKFLVPYHNATLTWLLSKGNFFRMGIHLLVDEALKEKLAF